MILRTLLAAGAALAVATPALAGFGASVAATGTSFGAYAVPAPSGLRCAGLSSPTSSRIEWAAVTVPPGESVVYVVAQPDGTTVTTSSTSHPLPVATPPGRYAVRAQISAGWRSAAATISVRLTVLGAVALCSVP